MKILVVDDEKLLVKGITFNLQNEGYEVTVRRRWSWRGGGTLTSLSLTG